MKLFKQSQVFRQTSAYEVCDRTCMPLHTPKTLGTC